MRNARTDAYGGKVKKRKPAKKKKPVKRKR